MNESMIDYIESRTEKITETGCWIWMKSMQTNGYGDFKMNNQHFSAHRASYEAFNGLIPKGLHVLHKCDVRVCCNPLHLFIGTNLDNITDSMKKGRRKGVIRNRPNGLKYSYSEESKKNWIERKRKLKESDRSLVFLEYSTGLTSLRKLAKKYNVTSGTILNIVRNK